MRDDGDSRELGLDGVGDADPDAWLWVRGVDYVGGWRAARDAADKLNSAFAAVGLSGEVRASAGTGAGGLGVVRLKVSPSGARRLAELLDLAARRVGRPRGTE